MPKTIMHFLVNEVINMLQVSKTFVFSSQAWFAVCVMCCGEFSEAQDLFEVLS